MFVPRSLVLSIVATTATIGFLLLSSPQVASASVTAVHASPGLAVSPSLCTQTALWPHQSTHVPGTMNGAIRAKCSAVVPQISLTAQMWETRWWGWDRIGKKGYMNAYNHSEAQAYGNDICRNATIRTTGNGFVIDVDRQPYYASTESIHVKNPCGL
jgi:hypothetical protein